MKAAGRVCFHLECFQSNPTCTGFVEAHQLLLFFLLIYYSKLDTVKNLSSFCVSRQIKATTTLIRNISIVVICSPAVKLMMMMMKVVMFNQWRRGGGRCHGNQCNPQQPGFRGSGSDCAAVSDVHSTLVPFQTPLGLVATMWQQRARSDARGSSTRSDPVNGSSGSDEQ